MNLSSFNFTLSSWLLLILTSFLFCLEIVNGYKDHKDCIEIKDGRKDLLKYVDNGDIYLLIDDDNNMNKDVDELYTDLCNRYKSSPGERIGNLQIGTIKVNYNDKQSKNYRLANTLQIKTNHMCPSMLLIKKGTANSSQSTNGAQLLRDAAIDAITNGEKSTLGIKKYYGNNREIDDVIKFIEDYSTDHVKVGTYIYHLPIMDKLISKYISIINNENPLDGPSLKEKIEKLFYICNIKIINTLMSIQRITRIQGNDKEKDATMNKLSNIYIKAFNKVVDDGDNLDYIKKQIKRIEGIIKKDDDITLTSKKQLKSIQREELNQKLHIYEKFTNPVDVTKDDERSFITSFIINSVMIVALIVSLIMLFIPVNDDEDNKTKVKEEPSDNSNNTNGNNKDNKDKEDEKEIIDLTTSPDNKSKDDNETTKNNKKNN